MKSVFLLLAAACLSVAASAQKVYFVYLQTEDQSPFYVRMGDKIFSSATSGYLILPNLTDSAYTMNIGFAKSSEPEAKFMVAVNGSDRGFILKKLDDGLALFDFQQLSLVKAAAAYKDDTVYETRNDAFTSVLSKAAGDPSIVKVPVARKEEPKPEEEKKEVATVKKEEPKKPEAQPTDVRSTTTVDTSTVTALATSENDKKTETPAPQPAVEKDTVQTVVSAAPVESKKQPAAQEEVSKVATDENYKPSVVSRHSESSTTEGFTVVYYDKRDVKTDTIRILIPASKVKLAPPGETAPAAAIQPKVEKAEATPAANDIAQQNEPPAATALPTTSAKNATCPGTASEKDFIRLRKKMVGKNADEDMIEEAKKDFRNRCYSVEQIRYLSTLFLSEATKYQFFDAAYQHVSDKGQFSTLANELKDDYYAKRFKALIGE